MKLKLGFVLFFLSFAAHVYPQSFSLSQAKDKCLELGFKSDTESLGNCVLKLSNSDSKQQNIQTVNSPIKTESNFENYTLVKSFKDCEDCPEMISLPAGNFVMGSDDELFSNKKITRRMDKPFHNVQVKPFAIGKYEVTQKQWYTVMGNNPSFNKGRTLPVENISWDDVQLFVQKLCQKTGKKYRLPSEAEWEYAARASTITKYFFDDDEELVKYGWFEANSNGQTRTVGGKMPNQFGLFDMLGNVWEFTHDCWNESYDNAPANGSAWASGDCYRRVVRGGSFLDKTEVLEVANRDWYSFSNQGGRTVFVLLEISNEDIRLANFSVSAHLQV